MQSRKRSRSPAKQTPIAQACAAIAILAALPPAHAGTLPQGGQFVAGTGSIATSGTTLTLNQNSARGIVDWKSFSIGNGNQVTINNGSGATLNRVTGGTASAILGTLSATGSVYVVNPQGIVVGSTGVVSTGGRFVASTLDVDNTAFMNGGALTFAGTSNNKVVNLGKIGSSQGDVFLIAANEVENAGSIGAPQGTVELAAGRQILLRDSASGQQVFVQTGSKGTVLDSGTIAAAQVSLQAADGNIYALSGNHDAIRATGTATRDGHVWLVAGTGTVELPQSIAATNADGSGGTVDTVAGTLTFCNCGPTVTAGTWNLTTPSYRIDDTAAAAFSRSLNAGTSINVQTTGGGTEGDVNVLSNIAWNGNASLALNAFRAVTINSGKTIANTGAGNLTLRSDATAIDNGGGVLSVGTIDWSKSTGIVSLYSDLNGTYVPGTLIGNTAWVQQDPAAGIVNQITAYRLVNSLADLQSVGQNLSGNYALGRDIEVNGSLASLGSANGPAFTGQFDGLGHVIDGASLDTPGLFYQIGGSGVVRNLGVTNGSISFGHCYTSACYTGLLTQENDGLVTRSYSTGYLSFQDFGPGSTYSVGGLVGLNTGTLSQSWSSAGIRGMPDFSGGPGSGDLGGLVADNNGIVTQSYATGAVNGGGWAFVGGLVGRSNGKVAQSFSTGPVSGAGGSPWWGPGGGIGGLIGGGSGGGSDDYWNAQTAGINTDSGGVPAANGLTTAQMSNSTSFAGWDFSSNGVWVMPAGATHPELRWQVSPSASTSAQSAL